MEDKAYWERKYKTSYDSANNFVKQNNLVAAKQSLLKALDAAIKLAEGSVGNERAKYKSDAAGVAELLERINARLESVAAANKVKSTASESKKEVATENVAEDEPLEQITVEEALAKLNSLEGLPSVKRQVSELVDLLKAFEMRKSRGLPVPPFSYHLVFVGNAGSGKTTVARIMAQIYRTLGILKKGQFVEVQRADLVADHVGGTAKATSKAIERAMGGVLFIDEAYLLYQKESGKDFGQEAITTLLKAMEDHRDEIVVIVAGYEKEMADFVESNPGLKTRLKTKLTFEDYTGEEMYRIFERQCAQNKYLIGAGVREKLSAHFDVVYANRTRSTGNARYVRNLFEDTLQRQSSRVVRLGKNVSDEVLMTILPEDLAIPTA